MDRAEMQSPSTQSLPWSKIVAATPTQSSKTDQITTRQLMPPHGNLSFEFGDATRRATPAAAATTAYPSSKSGIFGSEFEPEGRQKLGSTSYNSAEEVWDSLERVASENAVVMFSISSCCVCHVVKKLFSSLGVAPLIYELDQESPGPQIALALQRLAGTSSQALPAIFIGKKYIGGLEELISAHISGFLVPQLKQAGALWL
ncbi:hypothetical protein R1flu_002295 [Riccia fluitans]|uniref:Glutaredoxin domain-containing protein n=1 Tax=Riccia fluitans TaxID=41844 RepID=A0ABD1Y5V3_9MARC